MDTLLKIYALAGLAVGLAAIWIAGDTPRERRARAWSLIALSAALWPAALLHTLAVIIDEVRAGQPSRGREPVAAE